MQITKITRLFNELDDAHKDNIIIGKTIVMKKDNLGPSGHNPYNKDYSWVGFVGEGSDNSNPDYVTSSDIAKGGYKILKTYDFEINEKNYEQEAIKVIKDSGFEIKWIMKQDGYEITWISF